MGDWGATLSGLSGVESTLDGVGEQWGSSSTWVVGTNVEYAVVQEFGSSSQSGTPYLQPAVKQTMRSDADQLADQAESADELVKLLALSVERKAKKYVAVDTGNLKASISAERVD